MVEITKRTSIGALLLLILPIIVWLSGWQWQPSNNYYWMNILYLLTQTGTPPWAVFTGLLLLGWVLWCLHYRIKYAFNLIVMLVLVIVSGQVVKGIIKNRVQETRPFVIWLYQQKYIDAQAIYTMPSKIRSNMVEEELQDNYIPYWLQKHWCYETSLSFPSGHTIFAASWALLALGLLWPYRHFISSVVIVIWAMGVMASRIVLGMHWPQDLIMGVVIAWIIVTIACYLVQCSLLPLTPDLKKY